MGKSSNAGAAGRPAPEVRELERLVPEGLYGVLADRADERFDAQTFVQFTLDYLGAKDGKSGMQALVGRMWKEFEDAPEGSIVRSRILDLVMRMLGRVMDATDGPAPVRAMDNDTLRRELAGNLTGLGKLLAERDHAAQA